jgi:glycosyltransferase involved in cell wall biosynthesis
MDKKVNFIILNINAYAAYGGKDMAGSMRMKNLFTPILERHAATVSNLITLDLLCLEHNDHNRSDMPGVNCLSIGYTSLKKPMSVVSFLRKGIQFIKQHKKEGATNILYNYQYIDIRNIVFLLYAKMKGFTIVFDLVEDLNLLEAKTKKEKMHMATSRIFLKMVPFFADGIFVISDHIMQLTNKITKNKIPTFMLPISVNFDNIDHAAAAETSPGNEDLIKIFYGGSFAKKDGLEFLMEAIDILAERSYRFKLILSGKGEPADMERIFGRIKHPEVVDYRGFLSTQAYFALLNSVDICCMTRNNSAFANAGFPFKLGEFLAAGKIIIASRIGDVEKYVAHKESAYLITPASTIDIVEALTYCFDNLSNLKETMGEKARAVAMANFNSEVSSNYMLEQCLSVSQ